MRAPVESKAVFVSRRCYERLLAVYPECHRREYGLPMAQLFGDQCRDAWRDSRSWGLVTLWLRVLPDLVKTSVLEHLSAMKARKSMVEKISEITNVNPAPLRTFFTVFIVVFLLVFGTSAVVTYLLPESFRSTTRVKVERSPSASPDQNGSPNASSEYDPYFLQTEFAVIQSRVVLSKVIEALDLNAKWGQRYAGGEKLKNPEAMALLEARMDLRPVRNTTLIDISVYGEDRDETAAIANAIAEAYRDHRLQEQSEFTKRGIVALKDQCDEQDRKVREGQMEVDRLRKELNISDLESPSAVPTSEPETVGRLQGELISFESMLTKEEAQLKELAKLNLGHRKGALQVTVGPDNEFNGLLKDLNAAEQKSLVLQKDYDVNHPAYQNAKAIAEDASRRVNERMEGVMIGLSNRVTALQATVTQLQRKLDEARIKDVEKAERSRPYYEAKRRLEELTRFRTLLSMKLTSEKLDMSLPKSWLVEIMDRAEPAFRPVRPNKPLNLFLGAVVGVLLGSIAGGVAAWGKGRVRPNTSPVQVTSA